MDAVFSFLFETRAGFAVLFVGGLVVFAIVAVVLEKRTHAIYVDRGEKQPGEEGGLFDDLFGDDDD